jgi:hypothetical protein
MLRTFPSRRFGILLTSAIVFLLTAGVLARATQTFTVPNAATYSISLVSGAYSSPITPVTNQSVFVMGSVNTVGDRGISMAVLLHIPSGFIEWTGLESPSGSAITNGFNSLRDTHILYLDYDHLVDLRVASTDTVYVHNASSVVQTGDLKFIW